MCLKNYQYAWCLYALALLTSISTLYSQNTGSVTLAWTANSEPDLAGYRLYVGSQPRTYSNSINVGLTNTYRLTGLSQGATYYFALTAFNTSGLESGFTPELTYQVPLNLTNAPPTLNPIPDLVVLEDSGPQVVPLSGIGSGSPTEIQPLTVSAVSDNTGLVPNPTVNYTSPNATGSLVVQPVPNASGSARITVTVRDGQTTNNQISRSFAVTVSAVNDLPQISGIGSQSVLEDTSSAAIPFSVADAETPSVNLTLSGSSSNPALIDSAGILFGGTGANRTVTLRPAPNQYGTARITVQVRDVLGAVAQTAFALTVSPVNDAPYFDQPTDIVVDEGASDHSVVIMGIHSGALNEAQTLTISATSSRPDLLPHPQVVYTSPGSTALLTLRPTLGATGTVSITVTVNDGQAANGSFSRSFSAAINPVNSLPVISSIPDQILPKNRPSVIPFAISDGETPAESLDVTATSSNPSVLPETGVALGGTGNQRTLTLDPINGRAGTSILTVTVSDGESGSSTSFQTTVENQ